MKAGVTFTKVWFDDDVVTLRLHFQKPGKLYITIEAQSGFEEFGIKNVASEATLYLRSEPVLLDNFIVELNGFNAGKRDVANLLSVAEAV